MEAVIGIFISTNTSENKIHLMLYQQRINYKKVMLFLYKTLIKHYFKHRALQQSLHTSIGYYYIGAGTD